MHLDAAGAPDGYVAYRPGPRKDGHRAIQVTDLVALTPAAYLRLWRFLADLDLSDTVEWDRAPVDDPLSWALVDPFLARVTRQSDALWVRVLDVPAALAARPWGRDGEVVLEVADPLGHAAGRFRVVTRDGVAEVTRTDAEADGPAGAPTSSAPSTSAASAPRPSAAPAGCPGPTTALRDVGRHGRHRPGAVLRHRLLTTSSDRADPVVAGVVLELDQAEPLEQRREVHPEPAAVALALAVPAAHRVVLGPAERLDGALGRGLLLVGGPQRHPVALLLQPRRQVVDRR